MQLDRDVQLCGILFLVFLDTPCFDILLLPLFWRGSCLSIFPMLFDWSKFLYASLSIYFSLSFSMISLSPFARRQTSLELGVFIFGGWMTCFA
jgi:hypothetical protein